jgi:arginase family enzyme
MDFGSELQHSHLVRYRQLTPYFKIVAGRKTKSTAYTTPRIITLGGDHTTTLSALRSTYERWGSVSVIHFDSHIGETTNPPRPLPPTHS